MFVTLKFNRFNYLKMLVVWEIEYSQIFNFWQSECKIHVRYFFSILLVSNPTFRLLSFQNYSKKFFCNFNESISRHALISTKSWHWLRGCLYESTHPIYLRSPVCYLRFIAENISRQEKAHSSEPTFWK